MPLSGAPAGNALQEAAIMAVAYSSAPTGIISFALIFWGFACRPNMAAAPIRSTETTMVRSDEARLVRSDRPNGKACHGAGACPWSCRDSDRTRSKCAKCKRAACKPTIADRRWQSSEHRHSDTDPRRSRRDLARNSSNTASTGADSPLPASLYSARACVSSRNLHQRLGVGGVSTRTSQPR